MRSRRRIQGGGFRARRGDRIFRALAWISFLLMVGLPTTGAVVYFSLLASDQYVAEFKFTVAGAEPPPLDTLGALTGLPDVGIIQDTQIVVNHLNSRAAVEALERVVGIRAKYSDPAIDWWARFNANKPVEKLVRYWNAMVETSIKMPAGIIEVKVRAFRPDEALAISRATLTISEDLINELNDRMNRDALTTAENELARARDRLSKARLQLEAVRNEEGMITVQRTADGVGQLLTDSRGALLKLQQEYNAQLQSVSEQAPQMQALRARINAAKSQIAELEAKITIGPDATRLPEPTLSRLMTRFSELDLEKQISERLYDGAIAALEAARVNAERKTMYLKPFVQPTLPEDATYPRRALNIVLTFFGSLVIWGALRGLTGLIRNHMA
jgi:capsular polysaccharide transport system permease protein